MVSDSGRATSPAIRRRHEERVDARRREVDVDAVVVGDRRVLGARARHRLHRRVGVGEGDRGLGDRRDARGLPPRVRMSATSAPRTTKVATRPPMRMRKWRRSRRSASAVAAGRGRAPAAGAAAGGVAGDLGLRERPPPAARADAAARTDAEAPARRCRGARPAARRPGRRSPGRGARAPSPRRRTRPAPRADVQQDGAQGRRAADAEHGGQHDDAGDDAEHSGRGAAPARRPPASSGGRRGGRRPRRRRRAR